jgi:hypothetical protein
VSAAARRLLLAAAAALFAAPSAAQNPVGAVARVDGSATAQLPNEHRRQLAIDVPVFVLDRVETAPRAALRIQFRDGTHLSLGGAAVAAIAEYVEGEEPSFLAEVVRGTFRMVTGLVSKKGRATVKTRSAGIGVRGTNFGGEVDGERVVVMLLEPERGQPPGAIEVSNAFGTVRIDRPGFGTEVADAASPPSPPRRMRLRSVENLVRSVSTIQRSLPRTPR